MLAPLIESLLTTSLLFFMTAWALDKLGYLRRDRHSITSDPSIASISDIRIDRKRKKASPHIANVPHGGRRNNHVSPRTNWIIAKPTA